jgi:hypothetical protein
LRSRNFGIFRIQKNKIPIQPFKTLSKENSESNNSDNKFQKEGLKFKGEGCGSKKGTARAR